MQRELCSFSSLWCLAVLFKMGGEAEKLLFCYQVNCVAVSLTLGSLSPGGLPNSDTGKQ